MHQKTGESSNDVTAKIDLLLKNGEITLDELGSSIPGFVHINSRMDLSMLDINTEGQRMLGYSKEEILTMGPALLIKHQSPWTLNIVYPQLFMHFAMPNQDQPFTFVQDWIFSDRVKKKYYLLSHTHILNEKEYLTFTVPLEAVAKLKQLRQRTETNQSTFDQYYKSFHKLTKREIEVLQLLAENKSRTNISEKLFVSSYTVKKHCENIYQKLGTNSRLIIHEVANTFNI